VRGAVGPCVVRGTAVGIVEGMSVGRDEAVGELGVALTPPMTEVAEGGAVGAFPTDAAVFDGDRSVAPP
jgi:hypothetical protein